MMGADRRKLAELTSLELAELLGLVELFALVRGINSKLDDLRRAVGRNQEGIMTENRTTAELAEDITQLTAADAELAGQFSRFEGDFQAMKDQLANLPTDRPLTQQEQDDINAAVAGAEATLAAIKARTAAIVTVDPAAPLVIGDGGTGQGSTVVLNPTDGGGDQGGNAGGDSGQPTNPVAENPNTPAVPLDPNDPSQPADPTDPLVPTNSTPPSTDPSNNPVVTDPTVTDPTGNPVTVDPTVDQGTTTNPGAADPTSGGTTDSPTAGTPADPTVGGNADPSTTSTTTNAGGEDVGDGALPVTTSILGPQPSSTDPSDTHGATGASDLA